MNAWKRIASRMLGALLAMGMSNSMAFADIDWACCGLTKPKPTGVSNCCFGYFPTIWRSWPSECQPCSASYPIATSAPAPVAVPAPVETPAPKPVTETPPPKPAARAKPMTAPAVPLIVPASQALPVPAKPVMKLPDPSDSGWTPVPPAIKPKR